MYDISFANFSGGNPYTSIDTYVTPGATTSGNTAPNGALNVPGGVYGGTPDQLFSQFSGFNSYYAPITTFVGTTNSTTSVTSVNNTNELVVGMTVTGSGIPANTTITAISGTTLTLSNAATSSVALNQFTAFLNLKSYWNSFPPILKYVRYWSTNNPALGAAPGVVYYTDSTGVNVSGYAGEAFGNTTNQGAVNGNAGAGILLYNSTVSGLSGAASATALNGNWCWIVVGGLVPGVAAPASTVIGDTLTPSVTATDAFVMVRTAMGTATPYPRFIGTAYSNLVSSKADVLVNSNLASF